MAERSLIEQLDTLVDAVLAGSDARLAPADARLAPFRDIVVALRDLPRKDFRARLKQDLERRASMATPAVKPVREGFHTITPYLIVSGAAQFINFLKQAFGAVEKGRVNRPGTELLMHAEVRIGDSMVELADATPDYPPRPAAIHLYVEDVDAVYQRALEAGAASLAGPADQEYGERGGGVKDRFGNFWYIATHKGPSFIPQGLRSVTPYLHPRRAGEVIEFLKRAFGAEELARYQSPEGAILHAKVRIGDSILEMGEAHGPYQPMPCGLHLYVPDTDALYARAISAGATSIEAPINKPYGDRSAGVTDPFGNQWFIATHIKDVNF
ncbi:MAG TPA: VOC family protein [Candidatus Acidoferrales bacterium]|nr:VOC family protein [Candidatus Acidoferrales bacterium]